VNKLENSNNKAPKILIKQSIQKIHYLEF